MGKERESKKSKNPGRGRADETFPETCTWIDLIEYPWINKYILFLVPMEYDSRSNTRKKPLARQKRSCGHFITSVKPTLNNASVTSR